MKFNNNATTFSQFTVTNKTVVESYTCGGFARQGFIDPRYNLLRRTELLLGIISLQTTQQHNTRVIMTSRKRGNHEQFRFKYSLIGATVYDWNNVFIPLRISVPDDTHRQILSPEIPTSVTYIHHHYHKYPLCSKPNGCRLQFRQRASNVVIRPRYC